MSGVDPSAPTPLGLRARLVGPSRRLEASLGAVVGILGLLLVIPLSLAPAALLPESPRWLRFAWLPIGFALSFLALGVLVRYSMRLAPARLTGQRSLKVPIVVAGVLFVVAAMVIRAVATQGTSPVALGLATAASLAYPVGFVLLLRRRLRHDATALDRPFVLFLRRFGQFADRSLISAVLRAARPGLPVAFLQGPPQGAWYNDPLVFGVAGFKPSRPIASGPLFLRCEDAEWQDAAASLIAKATVIAIDVTDPSASIEIERELIEQAGAERRTVWLRAEHAPEEISQRTGRVVRYRASWLAASPRLLAVTAIMLLASASFFGRTLSHARGQRPVRSVPATAGDGAQALGNACGNVCFLGVAAFIAISMFLRPVASGRSRREIHGALTAVLDEPAEVRDG